MSEYPSQRDSYNAFFVIRNKDGKSTSKIANEIQALMTKYTIKNQSHVTYVKVISRFRNVVQYILNNGNNFIRGSSSLPVKTISQWFQQSPEKPFDDVYELAVLLKHVTAILLIESSLKQQEFIDNTEPFEKREFDKSVLGLKQFMWPARKLSDDDLKMIGNLLKIVSDAIEDWENTWGTLKALEYMSLKSSNGGVADEDEAALDLSKFAISKIKGRSSLDEDEILQSTNIELSIQDYKNLENNTLLLMLKFKKAFETCSEITYTENFVNKFKTRTIDWKKSLLDEFQEIEDEFKAQTEAQKQALFTQSENAAEQATRISDTITSTNILTISRKLENLVKKVEKLCPPAGRGPSLPSLPFQVDFKFTRDEIPQNINDWLSKPLTGKQNPKAVFEVILTNGASCPEIKVGDTLFGGWKVKIVQTSSRDLKWQTGELLVKKMDPTGMVAPGGIKAQPTDIVKSVQDKMGLINPFNPQGNIFSSIDSIKTAYKNTTEILEPMAAYYLQTVTKCRTFVGIQKPSDDDDDKGTGAAGVAIGSYVSISQYLYEGFSSIVGGVKDIVSLRNVLGGLQKIVSGMLSVGYTILVRGVLQLLLIKPLKWLLFEHPWVSMGILTVGVVVGPAMIASLSGYAIGSLQIPSGFSAGWFFLRTFMETVVKDMGLSTSSGLGAYFYSFGGIVRLLHATLCSQSKISKFVQAMFKYFFLKDVIMGFLQRRAISGPLSKAVWFYDLLMGSFIDVLFGFMCGPVSNLIEWAWNATSSFANAGVKGVVDLIELARGTNESIFQTPSGDRFVIPNQSVDQHVNFTTGRPGLQSSLDGQSTLYMSEAWDDKEGFSKGSGFRTGFLRTQDVKMIAPPPPQLMIAPPPPIKMTCIPPPPQLMIAPPPPMKMIAPPLQDQTTICITSMENTKTAESLSPMDENSKLFDFSDKINRKGILGEASKVSVRQLFSGDSLPNGITQALENARPNVKDFVNKMKEFGTDWGSMVENFQNSDEFEKFLNILNDRNIPLDQRLKLAESIFMNKLDGDLRKGADVSHRFLGFLTSDAGFLNMGKDMLGVPEKLLTTLLYFSK